MATTVFDLQAVLGIDTSKFESGLNKAKTMAGGLSSGLGTAFKVGAAAVTAATTAVVGFGAASVKTGAEFDKSMSQVAATMGKSMQEMQNEVGTATLKVNGQIKEFNGTLREFAQEMGRNTAFSATEAADALNYMALAGYDTQTSMNMLPNVLNLAAAGDMELARASDMVTDTQTAFGISLERTTQMVDEMAKAASTGNTSVEQLGDAFLIVGGLTQELNGGMVQLADGTKKPVDNVQELEIALTAMANAGIKGSEAGTHMRNMLLKLSSPTDKGAEQFKQLGVNVFDAEGNMRSLKDIMGDLNGALGNLTQERKIQAISALFNTRDIASAEALLNAVGQDWDKIGESILNAEGAAQKMADTQLDNLAGDITLFKSAFEGFQIAISDGATPALRDFVQLGTKGISTLTEAFGKFDASPYLDEMGRMTEEGAKAQAEFEANRKQALDNFFSTFTEGIGLVIEYIPDAVDAGMKLIEALGKGIIDNLHVLTGAATQIITKLSSALSDAMPTLISSASMVISDLLNGLISNLPKITPLIVDFIKGMAQIIADNAEDTIDAAIAIAGAIGEGLIESIPILVEKVPEIIDALVNAFSEHPEALVVLGPMLMGSLAKGITGSVGVVTKAMNVVSKAFDIFGSGGAVAGFLGKAGTLFSGTILPALSGLGTLITGTIIPAIGAFVSTLGSILVAAAPVIAVIGLVVAAGVLLYKNWDEIKEAGKLLVERTKEHFEDFKNSVSEKWNAIKENTSKAWSAIKNKVEENGGGIKGVIKTYAEGYLNLWKSAFSKINELTGGKLGEALNTVREKLTSIKESFDEKIQAAKDWGKDMIQNFIDGIKSKIQAVKDTVTNVAQSVKNILGFSEPEEGPLSNFHTFAPDMMALFAKGIRDNMSLVSNAVNESASQIATGLTSEENIATAGAGVGAGNIEALLAKYLPDIANMSMVLDTGALVGNTVSAYNNALGEISNRSYAR